MAGLGVGVGVPFALAFFAALWLLMREKKRSKALLVAGGALQQPYAPLDVRYQLPVPQSELEGGDCAKYEMPAGAQR